MGTIATESRRRVTPKATSLGLCRVSAVEAQALATLRTARRKCLEAESYLVEVRKGGSRDTIERAEGRAANARTDVTEARANLDLALDE